MPLNGIECTQEVEQSRSWVKRICLGLTEKSRPDVEECYNSINGPHYCHSGIYDAEIGTFHIPTFYRYHFTACGLTVSIKTNADIFAFMPYPFICFTDKIQSRREQTKRHMIRWIVFHILSSSAKFFCYGCRKLCARFDGFDLPAANFLISWMLSPVWLDFPRKNGLLELIGRYRLTRTRNVILNLENSLVERFFATFFATVLYLRYALVCCWHSSPFGVSIIICNKWWKVNSCFLYESKSKQTGQVTNTVIDRERKSKRTSGKCVWVCVGAWEKLC